MLYLFSYLLKINLEPWNHPQIATWCEGEFLSYFRPVSAERVTLISAVEEPAGVPPEEAAAFLPSEEKMEEDGGPVEAAEDMEDLLNDMDWLLSRNWYQNCTIALW